MRRLDAVTVGYSGRMSVAPPRLIFHRALGAGRSGKMMAEKEFVVEIPAGLKGKAAEEAAVNAFADKLAAQTEAELLKTLGL